MKRNILFTCVCILLLIAHCNQSHINTTPIPPIPSQEESQSLEISDSIFNETPDSIRFIIDYSYPYENNFQYTQYPPFTFSLM